MPNLFQRRMPSIMQHSFSTVPQARIPRSQFKRNFEKKTTFNADYLIPFYWDEVYPGDTANMRFSAIIRMFPLANPFMDNLYADFFFFFCPTRLIQTNWPKLMGERDNPADSIDFATPKVTIPAGGFVPPANWSAPTTAELASALYDYLEYPIKVQPLTADMPHNYLARMYNLQWNQHFRDQNLQNSVTVDKGDGPDTYTNYVLLKRGKRRDYFTSCLPFLQLGAAQSLPLGTSAPVMGLAVNTSATTAVSGATYINSGAGTGPAGTNSQSAAGVMYAASKSAAATAAATAFNSTNTNVFVDLTAATAATIGSLYQSFAIQDLLQSDIRGGTRYIELINSHFGVTSPDFRLQRVEYLGGASVPIIVSPIAQTSQTGITALGSLAAQAAASVNGVGFMKSFVEHGWLMGLVCIRADLTYQKGLHRSLSRSTRYDFYFPALANLAEQPVYNKEIYLQGTSADAQVFGYQERWSELRYGRSSLTGLMRANATGTLQVWHLSEEFTSLPVLNSTFIQQNTPVSRVLSVTTQNHFFADFFGQGTWVRPMPTYSVPGLMNRF